MTLPIETQIIIIASIFGLIAFPAIIQILIRKGIEKIVGKEINWTGV